MVEAAENLIELIFWSLLENKIILNMLYSIGGILTII
jgi:hypothetical protein